MATVTKRAACCNQATPARRTGQPAVGSRSSYSIARKKRRAKYLRRQITCLLLAAAALTALIYVVVGALTPDKPGTATVVTPRPVIETHTPIQTPAAEPTPAPRFELSAAERDVVERVVMAEAATVVSVFLIPWIKSKTTAQQRSELVAWAKIGVAAAEQIYVGQGRGDEKKQYVLEFLKSKGFDLNEESVNNAIEAAVKQLNTEGLLID